MTSKTTPPISSISARTRAAPSDFSPSERVAVTCALAHPADIVYASGEESARRTNVNNMSFRFCKRLGFAGLRALKLALIAELDRRTSHLFGNKTSNSMLIVTVQQVLRADAK